MKNNTLNFTFNEDDSINIKGTANREQIVQIAVWCIREYIKTADAVEEVDALNSLLSNVEADAVVEFLNEDGGWNDEDLN